MEVQDPRDRRAGRRRRIAPRSLAPLAALRALESRGASMPGFPHGLGVEELEGAHALLYERLMDVQRAHGQLVAGVLTTLPCAPEMMELVESTLYESESSTRRLGALLGRLFCAAGVADTREAGHSAGPTPVSVAVPPVTPAPALAGATV